MLIPPSDETSPISDKLRAALAAEGIDVNDPEVEIIVHSSPTEEDMDFLKNFDPNDASVEDLIRYRNLRKSRLAMSAFMLDAAIEAKENGLDYPPNKDMPTITLPMSVVVEVAGVVSAYATHLTSHLDRLIARRSVNPSNNN